MFDDLLEANRRYGQSFALRGLQPRAAKGLALITCIDTRIEPLAALGLRPGDAKILRNAGGRVTDDVLRSVAIAVALLGVVRVVVMHHTGCALAHRSDEDLGSAMVAAGGKDPEGTWLGAMPDPSAALAADVEALRRSPHIPAHVGLAGWSYDVETGLVTPVIA